MSQFTETQEKVLRDNQGQKVVVVKSDATKSEASPKPPQEYVDEMIKRIRSGEFGLDMATAYGMP